MSNLEFSEFIKLNEQYLTKEQKVYRKSDIHNLYNNLHFNIKQLTNFKEDSIF